MSNRKRDSLNRIPTSRIHKLLSYCHASLAVKFCSNPAALFVLNVMFRPDCSLTDKDIKSCCESLESSSNFCDSILGRLLRSEKTTVREVLLPLCALTPTKTSAMDADTRSNCLLESHRVTASPSKLKNGHCSMEMYQFSQFLCELFFGGIVRRFVKGHSEVYFGDAHGSDPQRSAEQLYFETAFPYATFMMLCWEHLRDGHCAEHCKYSRCEHDSFSSYSKSCSNNSVYVPVFRNCDVEVETAACDRTDNLCSLYDTPSDCCVNSSSAVSASSSDPINSFMDECPIEPQLDSGFSEEFMRALKRIGSCGNSSETDISDSEISLEGMQNNTVVNCVEKMTDVLASKGCDCKDPAKFSSLEMSKSLEVPEDCYKVDVEDADNVDDNSCDDNSSDEDDTNDVFAVVRLNNADKDDNDQLENGSEDDGEDADWTSSAEDESDDNSDNDDDDDNVLWCSSSDHEDAVNYSNKQKTFASKKIVGSSFFVQGSACDSSSSSDSVDDDSCEDDDDHESGNDTDDDDDDDDDDDWQAVREPSDLSCLVDLDPFQVSGLYIPPTSTTPVSRTASCSVSARHSFDNLDLEENCKLKLINDKWNQAYDNCSTMQVCNKKVSFCSASPVAIPVLNEDQWRDDYVSARRPYWEEFARDRDRFQRRVAETAAKIDWVFSAEHRTKVMATLHRIKD